MIKTPGLNAYLILAIQSAVWASAFQAIKYALESFGPITIAAARILIAAMVLLAWAVFKGDKLPRDLSTWFSFLLIGLFNCALPFFLIPWGEQTLDSGRAAIFMASGPLIAILVARFTSNDEQITGYKAAGFVIGFIGVFFVIGVDTFAGGIGEIGPQLAIITAAASYAVSGAMVKRLSHLSGAMVAAGVLMSGCIITLPLSLLLESPLANTQSVSSSALLALLYLGLFPTGAAFFVRFYLIRKHGYTFVAQVGYLVPIFSVMFGAILLDETISAAMIFGLCLILGGILLSRRGAPKTD